MEKDVEINLDFGKGRIGEVETEIMYAAALDSREAHITRSPQPARLKEGQYTVTIPHATGHFLTLK
jgi:hypothetical protein